MIKNEFQKLKTKIDSLLKDFLSPKQSQAQKFGGIYQELVEQIIDLVFRPGAERLRPILVHQGYQLGKISQKPQQLTSKIDKKVHVHDFVKEKEILKLSLSTELFHTAALIHDDIMDKAKERRGGPTIQEYFDKKYNNKDLANNLAILAGDLCLIWADEIFSSSKIPFRFLLKAKKYFDLLKEEVILGQTMDLSFSANPLKMYTYKTAKYSFERPLHLGITLFGADRKLIKILSNYSLSIGIAFQIQDDILGMFGKEMGKDTDSDIKEGKETLLVNITRQRIKDKRQKKKLEEILGNRKSVEKDIAWVKNLIKETGALGECQHLAKELIEKGKKALKNLPYSPPKKFLEDLADFCLTRES